MSPTIPPGRGSQINTSQGCVAYTKTCCARAMNGRRYAIIHSDPPAYCPTPSPGAFWNWSAGAVLRTQVGRYKSSSISQPNHRPFRSGIMRMCYGRLKQSIIMAGDGPIGPRNVCWRMNAWPSVPPLNRARIRPNLGATDDSAVQDALSNDRDRKGQCDEYRSVGNRCDVRGRRWKITNGVRTGHRRSPDSDRPTARPSQISL